jgi:hypothetical protein
VIHILQLLIMCCVFAFFYLVAFDLIFPKSESLLYPHIIVGVNSRMLLTPEHEDKCTDVKV